MIAAIAAGIFSARGTVTWPGSVRKRYVVWTASEPITSWRSFREASLSRNPAWREVSMSTGSTSHGASPHTASAGSSGTKMPLTTSATFPLISGPRSMRSPTDTPSASAQARVRPVSMSHGAPVARLGAIGCWETSGARPSVHVTPVAPARQSHASRPTTRPSPSRGVTRRVTMLAPGSVMTVRSAPGMASWIAVAVRRTSCARPSCTVGLSRPTARTLMSARSPASTTAARTPSSAAWSSTRGPVSAKNAAEAVRRTPTRSIPRSDTARRRATRGAAATVARTLMRRHRAEAASRTCGEAACRRSGSPRA